MRFDKNVSRLTIHNILCEQVERSVSFVLYLDSRLHQRSISTFPPGLRSCNRVLKPFEVIKKGCECVMSQGEVLFNVHLSVDITLNLLMRLPAAARTNFKVFNSWRGKLGWAEHGYHFGMVSVCLF